MLNKPSVIHYFTVLLIISYLHPVLAGDTFGSLADNCHKFYSPPSFWKKVQNSTKSYFADLKFTHGRSLILVEPRQEKIESKWKGILTQTERSGVLNGIIQFPIRQMTKSYYGSSYDLRPFKSIKHFVLQPAVRQMTKRLFKKSFELSKVVIFGIATTTSMMAFNSFEQYADRLTSEKFAEVTLGHRDYYKELIKNDFRFQSISSESAKNNFNADQIVLLSGKLRTILNNHFEQLTELMPDGNRPLNNSEIENLLSNPSYGKLIYGEILEYLDHGIDVDNKLFKTDSSFSKELTSTKLKQVIDIKNEMFLSMELTSQWILSPKTFNKWSDLPLTKKIILNIQSDPFHQQLIELMNTGKISQNEFIYLVQENIYWKGKFAVWKALGLLPIKTNDEKNVPFAFLTLEDIQNETLSGLALSPLKNKSNPIRR